MSLKSFVFIFLWCNSLGCPAGGPRITGCSTNMQRGFSNRKTWHRSKKIHQQTAALILRLIIHIQLGDREVRNIQHPSPQTKTKLMKIKAKRNLFPTIRSKQTIKSDFPKWDIDHLASTHYKQKKVYGIVCTSAVLLTNTVNTYKWVYKMDCFSSPKMILNDLILEKGSPLCMLRNNIDKHTEI